MSLITPPAYKINKSLPLTLSSYVPKFGPQGPHLLSAYIPPSSSAPLSDWEACLCDAPLLTLNMMRSSPPFPPSRFPPGSCPTTGSHSTASALGRGGGRVSSVQKQQTRILPALFLLPFLSASSPSHPPQVDGVAPKAGVAASNRNLSSKAQPEEILPTPQHQPDGDHSRRGTEHLWSHDGKLGHMCLVPASLLSFFFNAPC